MKDGTVEGTLYDDHIDVAYTGDPQGDMIDAGDAILGGAAPNDDLVYAYGGTDKVIAGDGDDVVYGGSGDDDLFGQAGNDALWGEDGQDKLWGGEGDDVLRGGNGDDLLKGQEGNDDLDGGTGDDSLNGADGSDTLNGGAGADSIDGGADADLIIGGVGDNVDGGSWGVDDDTLDLRGLPPYRLENLTPDSNGNGWNGTVVFLDSYGAPTGETIPFVEIENILQDEPEPMGDGTVEGTAGDDLIDVNYTGDPEGDMVDNNDALLPGAVANDDLIYGFAGNDTIIAGDGNDEIYGGSGNDLVYGGAGDDTILGNTGDDESYGGDGNDYFQDSIGNDTVYGDDGDDEIRASGGGNDTLYGGIGSDSIYGGAGNDIIDSSDGGIGLFDNPYPPLPVDPFQFDDRDSVDGGLGDDTIRTGDDQDAIKGGQGNDTINAGIDDDSVTGDQGNDTIIGGEGNDSVDGGSGNDLIYGGLDPSFPDSLNIPDDAGDLVPDNGMDSINGGAGDDTIFGMDDDDTITGGGGNDTIDGGVDDDEIRGGHANDTITGGQGNDDLFGGNDRDLFVGGNGGDVVDGGSGGDDYDTLNLTGSGVDFITYTSADREDGIVTFLDGTTMDFTEIENVIPCFTPGTAIATPRGERLVEELQVGDRIITRDNGIQEIRWVGRKDVSGRDLVGSPHLKPVMIKAGALGNGLPERDMLVSPNHRLLVANDRTQLYFEESEVLAAAKHLVGTAGIFELDVMTTSYIHFMFDRHEVVLSNGAWTESFQPGDYSLKGIGNAQRNEILELFPDLRSQAGLESYPSARKSLKKHEARLLVK